MRNAWLDGSQAGIKISRRNKKYQQPHIYKCYHLVSFAKMAESGEELKSLLMKVKEESEKVALKLFQKPKIRASGPIT